MPRDVNPNKRKADDVHVPLFDNATRSFVSRRFTEVDTSEVRSARVSRLKVQSFTTAGPQPPLFGNFNEDIYAMPNVFGPGDNADGMEIEIDTVPLLGRPRGNSLTPEGESISALPGIKITKKGPIKHYGNSVCEHAIFAFETYAN